jgi:hypothetical protein
MEWQPIETAPNETPVWLWDGSNIFIGERVFADDDDGWLWGRVAWNPWYDTAAREWKSDDTEVDADYRPTHWTPLPPPPAEQGEE